MNSTKSIENLSKLLRMAKQKTEEIAAHIADLEAAKASALTSLDWLEQAVRAEERQDHVNLVDLARYMEGATRKRATLAQTQKTLELEIESTKINLSSAFSEMKKLEHLLGAARRADQKRRTRREQDRVDDMVRVSAHG